MAKPILLSIQSEHAHRIYSGVKTAELRKTFPAGTRLVFLYETAPVSAVTGAFLVAEATKTSVPEAIEIAQNRGVSAQSARTYYGDRDHGWVVEVGAAVRFDESISGATLRELNHYFTPPQSYAFLQRFDALTQELMQVFVKHIASEITLRPLTTQRSGLLANLIRTDVAPAYEDIDEDFIRQILEVERGAKAAFSTIGKHVLEVCWRDTVIGFTVLTEKTHRAWKTGPSILLPEFRGLKLGGGMRSAIESYCKARHVVSVYCTCSDSRPGVVSYLLNSGMKLQARLVGHLARDRDELVFAKRLTARTPKSSIRKRRRADRWGKRSIRVKRVISSERLVRQAVSFFVRKMSAWYFPAGPSLARAIVTGMQSFEDGAKDYSAKGRALYAGLDSRGQIVGTLLVTVKRSGMIKVNVVADRDDETLASALLEQVMRDFKRYRRIYSTVAIDRRETVAAFNSRGFSLEGILQDPFSSGLNHLCFGFVRQNGAPARTTERQYTVLPGGELI